MFNWTETYTYIHIIQFLIITNQYIHYNLYYYKLRVSKIMIFINYIFVRKTIILLCNNSQHLWNISLLISVLFSYTINRTYFNVNRNLIIYIYICNVVLITCPIKFHDFLYPTINQFAFILFDVTKLFTFPNKIQFSSIISSFQ